MIFDIMSPGVAGSLRKFFLKGRPYYVANRAAHPLNQQRLNPEFLALFNSHQRLTKFHRLGVLD